MKVLLFLTMLFSPFVHANKKGNDIAAMVRDATKGYRGETATIDLSISYSSGKKRKRTFKTKLKEERSGGYSLLATFTAPIDLVNTKLLTVVSPSGYNQWLRMGNLKNVTKIEANSSSKAFVDSDLSYEDVAGLSSANFKSRYVKDSQGGKVWVLDQSPNKKSDYSKRSVYISKMHKYPIAIYFYSKSGKKIKTAEFKNFKKYKVNGKTFRLPSTYTIQNHVSGSQTTVQYKNRNLGVKFLKNDFSAKNL
ncbi:outer membrane lipoprotein-sorting protein [Bacteriovoracales bacterium]|nr:outer membrane lipoprotein-sorting protein [Bacteriovoracales bacterium]